MWGNTAFPVRIWSGAIWMVTKKGLSKMRALTDTVKEEIIFCHDRRELRLFSKVHWLRTG